MERTEGGGPEKLYAPSTIICTRCGSEIESGQTMSSVGVKEDGEVRFQHLFESDCGREKQGEEDG